METPITAAAGVHASQKFHIRIYLIIAAVSINTLSMAMLSAMISTTLGQPSFLVYFGFLQRTTSNTPLIGATLGVYFAAALFGSIFSSYAANQYGRRKTLMIASITSVIGTVLVGGSVHIAMLLVFRVVSGFGAGMSIAVASLLQSEIAPPHYRGLMVGLSGVMISFGYTLANWIGVAFYFVDAGGVQWRVPFILCAVPSLLVLCLLPIIPESPRWLCVQGRDEEAREVLMTLHGGDNAESQEFAKLEVSQMAQQIAFERTEVLPWWAVFLPKYRKRLILACSTMLMAQASGVVVVASYGPTIYASLGFSPVAQLCMTAGYTTSAIPIALLGTMCIDRLGRKKMMTIGTVGQLCCLAVVTALIAKYAVSDNVPAKIIAVTFFFIFQAFYCFFVEGASFAYVSELWPVQVRAQGVGIAVGCIFLVNIPLLEASLYAWTTIGWKFYLVFICAGSFFLAIFVTLAKETRNLSLEEIGQLFGDDVVVPQLQTLVHEHDAGMLSKNQDGSIEHTEFTKTDA